MPAISALSGALPRLSMATSYGARCRPRAVRGTSSAVRSEEGGDLDDPSSTVEPAGSSWEATRTPKGTVPALTPELRGGRNRMVARAFGAGEQRQRRGLHLCPFMRLAQYRQHEFVDHRTRVANADLQCLLPPWFDRDD